MHINKRRRVALREKFNMFRTWLNRILLRDALRTDVLLVIGAVLAAHAAADDPPNIVLIIADDLGYGELSPDASHPIPTPNLDRLIAGGTYCTNGYVTAPFCAASRAGLMAGRYQTRFGFEFNPIGHVNEEPGVGMPRREYLLPEMLRDAGYSTGLIGKWHLGGAAEFHPLRHGFEEFFGFLHEGHFFVPPPYDSAARQDDSDSFSITTMLRRAALPPGSKDGLWISPDGRLVLHDRMRHNEPPYDANNPILQDGQPVVVDQYLTRVFGSRAENFIKRHQQQQRPYFLTLAFSAVHSPLQAPTDVVDRFADLNDIHRQIFAAMYTEMDDAVGRVLDQIDRGPTADNTLVIFLSDNGGPTRELTSSNAPCRGEKGQVYEGGLRVPFVARWPGHIPAGRVVDTPVISLDIYETCRVAVGGDVEGPGQPDGTDLVCLLNGDCADERSLFWRVGNRKAVRRGPWKLISQSDRGARQKAQWRLFNVDSDVGESTDMKSQQPTIADELLQAWQNANADMVDAKW